MSALYLHTDKLEDTIISLEMFSIAATRLSQELGHWKWIVLALHSAIQSAAVVCLSVGNDFEVARQSDVKKWLKAMSRGVPPPDMKVDLFQNIVRKLEAARSVWGGLSLSDNEIESLKWLNELRNNFVHFMADEWSIELELLHCTSRDCMALVCKLIERFPTTAILDDDCATRLYDALHNAEEAVFAIPHQAGT